ncbi:MAG: Peptidoglycan O-acetyltransferase [Bacteroidetes bacterium ADurb.Bin302]|nr:MAG: Peptidoglycan O-acetyltransferase [Bacteroidetes bacterium ADurb.Bin302]
MLFNSYEFLFLFLPITIGGYFLLCNYKYILQAKIWLVLSSIFFYGWWNPIYIPLLLFSILFNYGTGYFLSQSSLLLHRRVILIIGICFNLGLLSYFKYADFFISNINHLTSAHLGLLNIALPLGISFFTFNQIAYLVDAFKVKVKQYSFIDYSLFVSFFPYLLSGPIIHHKEMMSQFEDLKNKTLNYSNLNAGMFLFFLGLFKKAVIADYISVYANAGFDTTATLSFFEAWITSLSYTLQLYFDFSGYTDMALGSALMFNIKLPINFNTPYKSLNIQEFWRRWHITLSRFMRDYIYVPLGGNQVVEPKILFNLFITFLIGGLWHGAGWTFILWGFLHGSALIIHRLWKKLNLSMPKALAWFITFNFVNIAWVFFRAKSWENALNVLKGMFGLNGLTLPETIIQKLKFLETIGIGASIPMMSFTLAIPTIFMAIIFAILFMNSNEMQAKFEPTRRFMIMTGLVFIISVLHMSKYSEFVYFRF